MTSSRTSSRALSQILKKIRLNSWIKIAQKYLLEKEAGRWFTAIVVLPLLLATFYLGPIASDRYVSNATFMIERSDGASSVVDGLNLFGMTPQSGNDQKILENFIKSPDMLSFLDQEMQLRKHYVDRGDWFSSLSAGASYDQFLQYYQEHINIRLNDSNGLLELEVQGFTPEFAQQLTLLILQRSEAFVNEISHNMATEQQAFVQKEVGLNEDKLRDATSRVIRFQNKYGILSASEEGAALTGVLNELQAELVRNRTELQTLSSYLNGSSSQIVTLKQRIRALEKQLSVEKKRLTDDGRTSLNDLAARQQELQLELDLATKAYSSALIALETTRTEASRKLKQLVVISSPYIAEEAKYPKVFYNLVNLLLILLMVFGLARMGYATVKEHRD
ncbi:hypothetical protein M3P05_12610 [Sansalvadorimonas sp. 2012CJ34-2]|uniref:Capsular polysaccharide transport system permease protein n=1 Tax=Parendozoicomonas callyspongiae TaxID=2942213 RepID=A0ABT0PHP5_9GAMM|nr:hypothetical protein [Sansalvadorimonas sp. 2012CJ34-2]MCL6270766.1 hypothetical protein [Sansalvadorimonas sp. 2012CJ34-2]